MAIDLLSSMKGRYILDQPSDLKASKAGLCSTELIVHNHFVIREKKSVEDGCCQFGIIKERLSYFSHLFGIRTRKSGKNCSYIFPCWDVHLIEFYTSKITLLLHVYLMLWEDVY
jgi:hypothetical protein